MQFDFERQEFSKIITLKAEVSAFNETILCLEMLIQHLNEKQ